MIVLASQKQPYDEAKGRAAGVDDHIVKPFDTQHVIDKVKRVMSQPRAAADQAPRSGARSRGAARASGSSARRPGGTIAFERRPRLRRPRPRPHVARRLRRQPRLAARSAPAAHAAPLCSRGAGRRRDLSSCTSSTAWASPPIRSRGVLALSRDVIEKVVWEVVPDLAETLISEEIRRLTQ